MSDPSTALLSCTAYPSLAAAIRGCAPTVLARVEQKIQEHLPAADALTAEQVLDHLPKLLEHMAATIEAQNGSGVEVLLADGERHGAERFHQSYNISELLAEYSLLRGVLIEELSLPNGGGCTLSVEELAVINAGIDTACRTSVEAFVAYRAREMQAANEAQSKYLSFLSHDLRGGLNGITLMLEVIKRQLAEAPEFGEVVDDVDVVRRSIFETVNMMDRFLHAERFRKGKVEVKLGKINLSALLHDVVGPFLPLAREKNVAVVVEVPTDLTVVSDRNLVQLIVQNLVGNAVKYSPAGTVRVTTAADAARGRVSIAVADEGPGIAADQLGRLFQPFSRGETFGQSGAGLGLSIARQAADLLHGELTVESQPGRGSRFTLDVPAN